MLKPRACVLPTFESVGRTAPGSSALFRLRGGRGRELWLGVEFTLLLIPLVRLACCGFDFLSVRILVRLRNRGREPLIASKWEYMDVFQTAGGGEVAMRKQSNRTNS